MKAPRIIDYITIDDYSASPKYLQLANSILNGIIAGKIKKDDVMPSINELCAEIEISRVTAEKGYKYLKTMGVVGSVPGKGYFILNSEVHLPVRVALFFNKLSAHKKIIYDSFVKAIGDNVPIDFYVYNNDLSFFKRLLDNKNGDYTHYVVIPHFLERAEHAHEIINTIPANKLLLLDKKIPGILGEYAAVYENFEKDIFDALEQAISLLAKYRKLKIIFPQKSYFPVEILKGFRRFCQEYAFSSKIVDDISVEDIDKEEAYICLMEDDLVMLIERLIYMDLKVGEDVGVISYNETPLKKIILNGITTISTDFEKMGELAANLILNNERKHIEVPFYLTTRGSL